MPDGTRLDDLMNGQRLEVVVIAIDPVKNHVALGLTDASRAELPRHLPAVGDVVQAEVVKLFEYGALVRLSDGPIGLVHISELADRYVKSVGEVVSVGETVNARVLSVETSPKLRIALTLKGVGPGVPSAATDTPA
jgi:predicted RNA-binding protein with RPS1 domain